MSKCLSVIGWSFALAFLTVTVGASNVNAQDTAERKQATGAATGAAQTTPSDAKDEAEEAQEAAEVLTELMNIKEGGIPEELMQRAKGIAVVPKVVKAALGIGGQWGDGLMSRRMANGQWSSPVYIDVRGGSFGLQIGMDSTDLVLVFNDEKGIDALVDGKLELGAEASVAAGPVGRNARVGTDIKLESAVFSYSRSKGLFAGVSLGGTVVAIDDSDNEKAYGKKLKAQEILSGSVQENAIVRPFLDALRKYTPAKGVAVR
jgi:lipid-binding SYLF domain-containing protein